MTIKELCKENDKLRKITFSNLNKTCLVKGNKKN